MICCLSKLSMLGELMSICDYVISIEQDLKKYELCTPLFKHVKLHAIGYMMMCIVYWLWDPMAWIMHSHNYYEIFVHYVIDMKYMWTMWLNMGYVAAKKINE